MGFLHLLVGTLMLRPYVFVFLAVYLFAAVTRMGWAKTVTFSAVAWAIAYAAEFSSTRNGFPFGLYVYVDATRDQELWLANVPFFDSLSFTFLCYLGYALAIFLSAPLVCGRGDFQVADTRAIRTSWRVLVTGAFLTTLLDLVIDPLTVRASAGSSAASTTIPRAASTSACRSATTPAGSWSRAPPSRPSRRSSGGRRGRRRACDTCPGAGCSSRSSIWEFSSSTWRSRSGSARSCWRSSGAFSSCP